MIVVNIDKCTLVLYPAFIDILDAVLKAAQTGASNSINIDTDLESEPTLEENPSGFIINFRSPDYSAETGGYHPVEVMISNAGVIAYVTDFAYVGSPPYAELAKELDFDFTYGLFGHRGIDYPLQEGQALFNVFQRNFVSYYQSGVFTVSVSTF